jgi:peptide/nickel transport system permease protein
MSAAAPGAPRRRPRLTPSAWIGAGLLGLFLLCALFGPWLSPHSATVGDLERRMLGPSAAHWLGTDENGVDLLAQILHGARLALVFSTVTVTLCATIGVTLGVVAGYFGGAVDEVVMRVVDVLLAFPGILLNLAIVAVVKRPGLEVVIFALVVNGWVGYARVARAQVLSVRELEFVAAARAVGAGAGRIMVKHIVPNILSPLLVQMTLGFGGVIAVEASLSFLGLGPQVGYSWGALLDQGTGQLWATQRIATVPGIAIMVVVLGSNLLGDGLRDHFDPRRART